MMARVVSVPYSMLPGPQARRIIKVRAAVGGGRMDVDDRIPAIEFFHHGPVGRIAEPGIAVACQKANAVSLERVVGIGDLLQRCVDVG